MMKKIVSLALTLVMAGIIFTPIEAEASNTKIHTHIYGSRIETGSYSSGSYSHTYVTGYIPALNQYTYGDCVATRTTHTYTFKCLCGATAGYDTSVSEYHGSCGK